MRAGCVEEVIGHMAGYVRLTSIAEAIMGQYRGDRFGDFKVRALWSGRWLLLSA